MSEEECKEIGLDWHEYCILSGSGFDDDEICEMHSQGTFRGEDMED